MRSGALLLPILLLAGCLSDAAVPAASPEAPPVEAAPRVAQAFAGCARGFACFEPTVAVDGAGRIVVTDALASRVAFSEDGGATFQPGAAPPLEEPAGQANDVTLQAAPDGRVYWSALAQLDQRPLPFAPAIVALQVAWTEDGGRTWGSNVVLLPPTSGALPGQDRQWLAFGPSGEVYLTYNHLPTGLWVARSDDGGRSFGGFVRAVGIEQGVLGQAGVPAVDRDGRLFVPAFLRNGAPGGSFAMAVSEDRGASFALRTVFQAEPTEFAGDMFAMAFAAPDGSLVAHWTGMDGDVLVSRSVDQGRAWSAPERWASGGTDGAPWALADGADLVVGWLQGDGETLRLHVGRAPLALVGEGARPVVAALEKAYPNQQGERGNGDFASLALGKDGAILAALGSPEGVDVARLG